MISLSLASFAGNEGSALCSNSNTQSIEKAKPHTQQYLDIKNVFDEFEQDVDNAKTCEDLEVAEFMMYLNLLEISEEEYDEELTKKEEKELEEQLQGIQEKEAYLKQLWNCKTEEDAGVEEE